MRQGDSDSDIIVPYLILGRVGYGYSISKDFYGTFSFGLGSATGQFEGEIAGENVQSDKDMTGLAVDLGYNLGIRVGRFFEFWWLVLLILFEYSLDNTVGDVLSNKKL